jgi:hypothetical protein
MMLHCLRRFAPYSLAVLSLLVMAWATWRIVCHPDAGIY